ncbi:MAG: Uma2 family endonuclease [Cyanobacteriota bacterium]|nr:Uma2 family endonuclease [Cyanobacteriota bacterium]
MVPPLAPVLPQQNEPSIRWEALPHDVVLPDEPVENLQQPALAAALTDALGSAGRIQPQMLMGTNFALVATIDDKWVVKAPDWFYVPSAHPVAAGTIRRSYAPHAEGSTVEIVMEFLSETDGGELSIRSTPPFGKLYFYEQILQVATYVTYDPYRFRLEVRQLIDGCYQAQRPNAEGRFWIPALQLWLGIWHGERLGQVTHWLRWWDPNGHLLLWSSEQALQERQRAEQERQRADALAAKLQELGIDPANLT